MMLSPPTSFMTCPNSWPWPGITISLSAASLRTFLLPKLKTSFIFTITQLKVYLLLLSLSWEELLLYVDRNIINTRKNNKSGSPYNKFISMSISIVKVIINILQGFRGGLLRNDLTLLHFRDNKRSNNQETECQTVALFSFKIILNDSFSYC
jgi:hypothetical protein